MHLFYRRPMALICAAFIVASVAGFYFDNTAWIAAGIALISAVVCAVIFIFAVKRWRNAALLILAMSIASMISLVISYSYFEAEYENLQDYVGQQVQVEGLVVSRKYSNGYSSGYKVRIHKIQDENRKFTAILDCEYLSDLQPGYRFELTATGDSLGYNDSSDIINELSDGFMLRLISESDAQCNIVEEDVFDFEIWLSSLNRRLSNKIRSLVDGEGGELTSAIALGDRSGLSYETTRNFRRAGASHLLALSGLHMAIVMGICDWILKRLSVTKWIRCIVLLVGLCMYLAITGFSVSACRAAIMLALVYISFFFSVQTDSVTSLFIAGALIIAVSPPAVVDVGFWLSFLATLGIIVGVPAVEPMLSCLYVKNGRRHKIMKKKSYKIFVKAVRYVVLVLAATLAANAATAFVVCLCFGEMSLWTPVTNFILSPLTSLLLVYSVLFAMLGWSPFLAKSLARGIAGVSEAMLNVSERFAMKNGSVISLRYDFAWIIILAMSLLLLILALIKLKRKWLIILPIPMAVIAFALCFTVYINGHRNEVDITYLQRGKNEMMVFSNETDAIICDLSDGSYSNVRMSLDAMRDNYATEVSAFMVTHYHQRHISSIYRLMCSELVEQLWLPYPLDEREYNIMWSIVYYAERCNCDVVVYKSGEKKQVFDIANVQLFRDYIKRSTHPMLVLNVSDADSSFTFIGASVHESNLYDTAAELADVSQYVIFGLHGPITKKHYSYKLSDAEEIIFANDVVMSYFKYDEEAYALPDDIVLVRAPKYRKIKLISNE